MEGACERYGGKAASDAASSAEWRLTLPWLDHRGTRRRVLRRDGIGLGKERGISVSFYARVGGSAWAGGLCPTVRWVVVRGDLHEFVSPSIDGDAGQRRPLGPVSASA